MLLRRLTTTLPHPTQASTQAAMHHSHQHQYQHQPTPHKPPRQHHSHHYHQQHAAPPMPQLAHGAGAGTSPAAMAAAAAGGAGAVGQAEQHLCSRLGSMLDGALREERRVGVWVGGCVPFDPSPPPPPSHDSYDSGDGGVPAEHARRAQDLRAGLRAEGTSLSLPLPLLSFPSPPHPLTT